MDPVDAAHRLVDALGTPMAMPLVGADAADFLLQARKPERVLDLVMKRNLVFLSWQAGDDSGTWILSFDRNGILTNWTAMG